MLTFAFCTYKRADRLEKLVAAMRAQSCPIPFEVLAINNNSPDDTLAILERLALEPGPPLRVVTEHEQGIVPARNRALQEAMASDILVFIDDDEMPWPGLLEAACDAIRNEGARSAGGRVVVNFEQHGRPRWLTDDLLGFLAEVDHGPEAFWIKDTSTPVWTANVAYDMRLFRDDPTLRFDQRYNRQGVTAGGGSDAIMFRALLDRQVPMRYRPEMVVDHFVEEWRLHRRYFLRLHYRDGLRKGRFEVPAYERSIQGIPPFMVRQAIEKTIRALGYWLTGHPSAVRQGMNATHVFGMMTGLRRRWQEERNVRPQ